MSKPNSRTYRQKRRRQVKKEPIQRNNISDITLPPQDKVRLLCHLQGETPQSQELWDYGVFGGVREAQTHSLNCVVTSPAKFRIINSAGREVYVVERTPNG
jgi:hypothetical protein